MQADSERREELVQTFGSLYQPISEERGCLGCHFYSEIGNDDAMLLIEEWESERHWRAHLQSREFAVLLGAMSLMNDPKTVAFKLLSKVSGVGSLKKMRQRLNHSFPEE
jgi:quinol monooxygenase YgiN